MLGAELVCCGRTPGESWGAQGQPGAHLSLLLPPGHPQGWSRVTQFLGPKDTQQDSANHRTLALALVAHLHMSPFFLCPVCVCLLVRWEQGVVDRVPHIQFSVCSLFGPGQDRPVIMAVGLHAHRHPLGQRVFQPRSLSKSYTLL